MNTIATIAFYCLILVALCLAPILNFLYAIEEISGVPGAVLLAVQVLCSIVIIIVLDVNGHRLHMSVQYQCLFIVLAIGMINLLTRDLPGETTVAYLRVFTSYVVMSVLGYVVAIKYADGVLRSCLWMVLLGYLILMVCYFNILYDNILHFKKSYTINYLSLSDAFLVISLLLLPLRKTYLAQTIYVATILIVLILFQSRAAYIAWCITVVTALTAARVNRSQFIKSLPYDVLAIIICTSILYAVFQRYDLSPLYESRIFKIVYDYTNDPSAHSRQELARAGIDDIMSRPLKGNFAGQLEGGDFGGYIHNILSYWRQFGILGFCMAIVAIVWSYRDLKCVYRTKQAAAHYKLGYVLLGTMILMVLFARSFTYPYVWLAIGYAAGLRNSMAPSPRERSAMLRGCSVPSTKDRGA